MVFAMLPHGRLVPGRSDSGNCFSSLREKNAAELVLRLERMAKLADLDFAGIDWIEKHVGKLNATRRKWLESRRGADIW
jgi:hypothetical protein